MKKEKWGGGNQEAVVMVELTESGVGGKQRGSQGRVNKGAEVNRPKAGQGNSSTPAGGVGLGTDLANGGDPTVLQKIRQKILAVKEYPLLARRQNIQGNVGIVFRITPTGGVDNVSISSSSGSELLDDEAIATVKRGAPFPLYTGEISLVLKFDLNQ